MAEGIGYKGFQGNKTSGVCFPFLGYFKVTSVFGVPREKTQEGVVTRWHLGMDLVGQDDKRVVSISPGVVKAAGPSASSPGVGNRVWVLNDDGCSVLYCHLESWSVKPGQRVDCKTPLGIMGHTGHCIPEGPGGTHLHIGIFADGVLFERQEKAIDPALYLMMDGQGDLVGKTFNGARMCSPTIRGYETIEELQKAAQDNFNSGAYIAMANGLTYSNYKYVVEGSENNLDILYGRRYRIYVVDNNGDAIDVSSLRCTFSLVKSIQYPQLSEITIYNLSAEDENRIMEDFQNKKVYIEAGYASQFSYGLIYSGSVIQAIRARQSTDFLLTLILGNGIDFTLYEALGVTTNAQSTMRNVVNEVAQKAGNLTQQNYGLSLGQISERTDQIVFPRGKVIFGKSSKILEQMATSIGSIPLVENGIINIIAPETLGDNEVIDVSPESGLIGSPTQTELGVSLTCLLSAKFEVNNLIHLDNVKVRVMQYTPGEEGFIPLDNQGLYRIIKITYEGDTRGQSWFAKLDTISQVGLTPNSLYYNYASFN